MIPVSETHLALQAPETAAGGSSWPHTAVPASCYRGAGELAQQMNGKMGRCWCRRGRFWMLVAVRLQPESEDRQAGCSEQWGTATGRVGVCMLCEGCPRALLISCGAATATKFTAAYGRGSRLPDASALSCRSRTSAAPPAQ